MTFSSHEYKNKLARRVHIKNPLDYRLSIYQSIKLNTYVVDQKFRNFFFLTVYQLIIASCLKWVCYVECLNVLFKYIFVL